MKRTEDFIVNGNRYRFDFVECTAAKNFAQVDSESDAWYFGQWANPIDFEYVCYAEGDVTRIDFDNAEEFTGYLRDVAKWHERNHGQLKIDPMGSDEIKQAFINLGLADLLH
jgi:hypothetical protein